MPTKKTKKASPRAPHGTGVIKLTYDLIRAGKTNEEALKTIKNKFPAAKTNLACVSWCRTKLRSDGEKIKTNRELQTPKKKAA